MSADQPTCRVCHRETGDTAWLCGEHTTELQRMIAELPTLMAEVQITATRQDHIAPTASPRRKPVEESADWRDDPHLLDRPDLGVKVQALPLQTQAAVFAAAANNKLTTTIRDLAESRKATVRINPDPASMCAWLLRNVSSIRLDESCGQIHRDIHSIHRQAEQVIDSREDRVYLGPCAHEYGADETFGDHCCTLDLYATLSAETVVCDGWGTTDGMGCGAQHTIGSKRMFLLAQLEDARATMGELVAAIGTLIPGPLPPGNHVRAWKSVGIKALAEGRTVGLMPVGDRNGEPLWRGGDVVEAVRGWRGREALRRQRERRAA